MTTLFFVLIMGLIVGFFVGARPRKPRRDWFGMTEEEFDRRLKW